MKLKYKFNKSLNEKLKRFRINNQITREAIKELWKYRGNYKELLNKHTIKGKCKVCGNEGIIIKNVMACINCSFKYNKGIKDKISKDTIIGKCKCCGIEGTLDKEYLECMNCYTLNGRGGIKKE